MKLQQADTTSDENAGRNGISDSSIGMKYRLSENFCNYQRCRKPTQKPPKENPKERPIDESVRNSATSTLLRIVTGEIEKDGGACLVTTLKDYITDDNGNGNEEPFIAPKAPWSKNHPGFCHKSKKKRNQKLNSLLIQSNVGKPKLLAFLESHPNIFRVDRSVIPHWVQLVATSTSPEERQLAPSSTDMVGTDRLGTFGSIHSRDNDFITGVFPFREDLRTKLFHKALYALRKREARVARRKRNSVENIPATSDESSSFDERSGTAVNCHWLLGQCSWELHFFLRSRGFYQDSTLCGYNSPSDVQSVGSKGWEDIVLPMFERIIRAGKENSSCNGDCGELIIISWIHIHDGRASLRQSYSHNENQTQSKSVQLTVDKGERGDDCGKQQKIRKHRHHNDAFLSLVRRIDQTLTEIVCRKDGGHQISLQLLLHRYPYFKDILGGRDLWKLYSDFSNCKNDSNETEIDMKSIHSSSSTQRVFYFDSISIFHDGPNLIIKSKQSKTNDRDVSNDECISRYLDEGKRMKVDEQGLYSVTSTKWGKAMTNLMIQACRQTNLFDKGSSTAGMKSEDKENQRRIGIKSLSPSVSKLVVDLTASVGGMTLSLAKSKFFDRVLALEIDGHRAELCRENLSRHGFRDFQSTTTSTQSVVEIRHQDSVEQLPFLPRRACFVIDPPWGGYQYKQKVRYQQENGSQLLKLGETPLEEVVAIMSRHNSPCVVGLRLPTNFALEQFLSNLSEKNRNIRFECMTCRKISVQLFVVLHLPDAQTNC